MQQQQMQQQMQQHMQQQMQNMEQQLWLLERGGSDLFLLPQKAQKDTTSLQKWRLLRVRPGTSAGPGWPQRLVSAADTEEVHDRTTPTSETKPSEWRPPTAAIPAGPEKSPEELAVPLRPQLRARF